MVKKRKKIKEGDKAYNPNEARNKAIAMARKMKKLREKKTKITKPKTKKITKITIKPKTKKITKITIKQTKKTKVKKKTLTAVRMKKHLTQINKQLRKELIKGVWKMRKPELTKAFNKHMEIMDDGWYRPTDDLKELYENKKWDFEAFKKL
tara:strand:- start:3154 stop:3606 length:453 start_codon:yes stop_codon:yes gene_type:complete